MSRILRKLSNPMYIMIYATVGIFLAIYAAGKISIFFSLLTGHEV